MKCAAIVSRLEDFNGSQKWFVNQPYVSKIQQYGWAIYPIVSYASLRYAIEHCDCLISPGGYDLQGYYLNEKHRKECTYYPSIMDHFDFDCIDEFFKAKKPILGICRGMQVLNVYCGGSILSHIDDEQHQKDNKHTIEFSSHSFLHQLYDEPLQVNSFHHQVVGKLGKELYASAYSQEMYIEAIQHKHLPIIAVQWHPELLENDQIFPYFFDVLCA